QALEPEADTHLVHPALLDASLQVLAAAMPGDGDGSTGTGMYLPTSVDSMRVYSHPVGRLWSHGVLRPGGDAPFGDLQGDIRLLDESGRMVAEVMGLHLRSLIREGQRAVQEDVGDWLYTVEWQPKARPEPEPEAGNRRLDERGSWLIFTDGA